MIFSVNSITVANRVAQHLDNQQMIEFSPCFLNILQKINTVDVENCLITVALSY